MQHGHRAGAIAAVTVGVLMELGVPDSVPAVTHQMQQGFWGGAQAVEERVGGMKLLAITTAGGHHLHDPAGADPVLADVHRNLFCSQQHPGDVATVADLLIRCHKRDRAPSLELAADLTMQRLLVGFHRQQEVGPLLLELPKKAFGYAGHPPGSARPQDPTRQATF